MSKIKISFPAQVPDDEQFVPDFQSDNCKYLSSGGTCVLKLSSLGSFVSRIFFSVVDSIFGQWDAFGFF